jgi:RNA polymerase sigma factor (sigma-70 family)|tara:strand:+ start:505 stop:1089 length:585 start_codon:yes stop_codon:yes gene_type:complete
MGSLVPQIDSALVAKACKGNREAHAKLYELCSPMVYTLARRMLVSRVMAEDVLQETFVEVIRKISSYRGEAGFAFWVRRIAVNKCLMNLRSAWNSRRLDIELTDDICPKTDGEQAGKQADLEYALAELSATSRAVVLLHDVEGYTHKEIGQMMGKTTSFSKSQLARAHERLRGLLDDPPLEDERHVCISELKTY